LKNTSASDILHNGCGGALSEETISFLRLYWFGQGDYTTIGLDQGGQSPLSVIIEMNGDKYPINH
jgi:hypothetical protein